VASEEDLLADADAASLVKIGKKVHIPASIFPNFKAPKTGYWVGKTCKTSKGGQYDIGIHIEGEDIFTRPVAEVADWLAPH
jgi:hypothetical protein